MSHTLPPCLTQQKSRELIEEVCIKHGLDVELVIDALEVNRSHTGSGRRAGINADFSEVINAFLERTDRNGRGAG